jgi:transcriptional regulator with GAF, ATPase, and Fis domain
MRAIGTVIEQIADTDATVLIRGESGVGKDLVARAIHAASTRRRGPFVKINCAAIPQGLLESEFFGHERGAFTGAHRRKYGQFEYANRGTIYLDELAELPLALQAKLLHVLQDFRFSRVGGHQLLEVDTRVVAATNRDLEEAMARGEFREDLYHRLNVVEIKVPPLRSAAKRSRHWHRGSWPGSTRSTGGRSSSCPRSWRGSWRTRGSATCAISKT